ncbi:MAG: potassium/proton antiporter [Actinomycetota bacterium]
MTVGFPIDGVVLAVAALMVAGALLVGVSDRLRVPASLISLAVGMVVGSDGLGWINVDDAALVRDLSIVALIVILFEGGLTTKPSALKEAGLPALSLATVGVAVTAGVTALGAQLVFRPGWEAALLLGAVVASTDAAVVFDLLRRAPLPRRLAEILEVESGANDPFAILLTVGLVASIEGSVTASSVVLFGAVQLMGGAAVGVAVGGAGVLLLRTRLRSQALYPILATGVAGLAYAVAAQVSASGFLAVFVAGLLIGARVPRQRRVIRSFYASLATGTDIALFLMLGLLVLPSELPTVMIPGLALTAILILVARPVAVLVTVSPFGLSWRERTLLSWAGLRGAVPIVLATIPATAGVPGGETIFNLVFFVVVVSTLLQGTTVVALAQKLGLTVDRPAWQSIAEAVPLEGVDVDLVEIHVTPDLPLVGRELRQIPPLPSMLVTAVVRGGRALLPRADTVFQAGDLVMMAVDRSRTEVQDVTAWARGELLPGETGAERPGEGRHPPP